MKKNGKKYIEVKTRYGTHTGVLEPDEKGYVVTVPGLPGVVTWGRDFEHAKKWLKTQSNYALSALRRKSYLKP